MHGSSLLEYCLSLGLLLSCCTGYKEASILLYRANRFCIRYRDHRSLELLLSLIRLALSNLTNLKVLLNEASCHP